MNSDSEIVTSTAKPHVNLVMLGHCESGKSTTAGHLIYKAGGISSREMDQLARESNAIGKGSHKFALVVDQVVSYSKLETPKYRITLINTPGQREFIKNMITCTSQGDVAILI